MKICPNCRAEYEDTINVCADCEVELISSEDFKLLEENYIDWEVVYTTPELYEAEMVKTNLESANIDCVILDQKDSSFPLGGEMGVLKVLVRKSDFEEALQIIKNSSNPEIESNDASHGEQ